MLSTERRYTAGVIELRDGSAGKGIGGYALKFSRLSQNLGGFVERVNPGAVTKTIADGGDVLARFQHEDAYLLGRTSAGTLALTIDTVGLDYAVETLPDTTYARDLAALVERGDVRHSSFAFRTVDGGDDWGLTEQGFPLRTLLELQLIDVAPVVQPAYLDTTSGMRSLAARLDRPSEEISEALATGRLAELLQRPATVIDLTPQRSAPHTPVIDTPGETRVSLTVSQRRLALLAARP